MAKRANPAEAEDRLPWPTKRRCIDPAAVCENDLDTWRLNFENKSFWQPWRPREQTAILLAGCGPHLRDVLPSDLAEIVVAFIDDRWAVTPEWYWFYCDEARNLLKGMVANPKPSQEFMVKHDLYRYGMPEFLETAARWALRSDFHVIMDCRYKYSKFDNVTLWYGRLCPEVCGSRFTHDEIAEFVAFDRFFKEMDFPPAQLPGGEDIVLFEGQQAQDQDLWDAKEGQVVLRRGPTCASWAPHTVTWWSFLPKGVLIVHHIIDPKVKLFFVQECENLRAWGDADVLLQPGLKVTVTHKDTADLDTSREPEDEGAAVLTRIVFTRVEVAN